jgi:hypothetical protein
MFEMVIRDDEGRTALAGGVEGARAVLETDDLVALWCGSLFNHAAYGRTAVDDEDSTTHASHQWSAIRPKLTKGL